MPNNFDRITMSTYQTIGLILYFSFYTIFYVKLFLQKRRHIKTIQIIRGQKPKRTAVVELLLIVTLFSTALIQFVSIVWVQKIMVMIQSDWVRSGGIPIAAAGIIVLVVSMATMRDSWKGGIDYNQRTKLVTTGIYQYSRNPGFTGFDLFYAGLFLLFPNLFNLIFSGLLMIMLHLQILEEEKYLTIAFGQVYADYKKKTRRYF